LIERLKKFLVNSLYTVLLLLLFLPIKVLFRLRIRGREMIKRKEGYIIVARHRSYWDIPLLVEAFGWRNHIHFIARKGLRKNPVFRPLLKLFSTTIDRNHFTKTDFRRTLEAVRRERLIGIFPEGTTKYGVDAKGGAIRFAQLADKKFLPVNISVRGPYPPRYPFHFPRVTVTIGEAISVSDLEAALKCGQREANHNLLLSQQLMERVDAVR
jgi:1-acyl-sn-glycerol-3-phosphate acyltransferase